ncbi:MAG: hypothetical protein HC848_06885 [Limnobacter sp.]|nr:hypothetical protein [Limnobacter sp.]
MESTGSVWAQQRWKNKLAAGFTNSSSRNGDKLNTLTNLSLFAAQHGMLWIPLGILPQYDAAGKQLPEPNGMASYLGLMTLSNNSHAEFHEPADLLTAELFGQHIANPIAMIWSGALMLDFIGQGDPTWKAAHDSILAAIETVLQEGPRTPDLGGKASTSDIGKAVAECVRTQWLPDCESTPLIA